MGIIIIIIIIFKPEWAPYILGKGQIKNYGIIAWMVFMSK